MKIATQNPFVPPKNEVPFDWQEAKESLREFNSIINKIKDWDDDQYWKWSPDEILEGFDSGWGVSDPLEALSTGEGGDTGAAGNPAAGQHLGFWILQNFGYGVYKKIQDIHKPISDIATDLLQEGWEGVSTWGSLSEEDRKKKGLAFLTKVMSIPPLMEEYAKEINKLFPQIYPDRFKYEGFVIENLHHFAKPLVHELLGGIQYLLGLFKNNGLLPIFKKGIKKFVLAFQPHNKKDHALYFPDKQEIVVYHIVAKHRGSRLLKTWVKEVFLHEFGHHIHMDYIHGIAKNFWDEWWDLVEEAKDLDQKVAPITYTERMDFFAKLVENDYDPAKAMKDLPLKADRIRFALWMNNPSKGNKGKVTPYYNPGRPPKLTEYGEEMFEYFRDSYEFIEKRYPEALRDKPGTMGFGYQKKSEELQEEYDKVLGIDGYDKWPKLPRSVEKDIKGTAPTEVEAIDRLGVPSDYARKNKYEDFAESFVSFVTNPRSLSDLALYRMKRTLSLSGLYGKPVMTFASTKEGNLKGKTFSWYSLEAEVKGLNRIYESIKNFVNNIGRLPSTPSQRDFENFFEYFFLNTWVLGPPARFAKRTPFGGTAATYVIHEWVRTCFGPNREFQGEELEIEISKIANKMMDLINSDTQEEDALASAVRELLSLGESLEESFSRLLSFYNKQLQEAWPKKFKYAGFVIDNPDHLCGPRGKTLLSGIDFVKRWFKDRHLLQLFEKGIKSFTIRMPQGDENSPSSKTYAMYSEIIQRIELLTTLAWDADNPARFLDSWLKEVMIHEFGHYIHMHYIHGIAKDFWDEWWALVRKAQAVEHVSTAPITREERDDFFGTLIYHDFDPKDVAESYSIDKRVRFLVWLNDPSRGYKNKLTSSLKFKGQPKLTEYGQQVFSFFRNSKAYIKEYHPEDTEGAAYKNRLKSLSDEYEKVLGLASKDSWPKLTPALKKDLQQFLLTHFKTPFESEVKGIAALNVPSDYAKKNKEEDFAESFVLFVTEPRRLSPMAQYRMKRTLSLSGLYGKPVMTFASVVTSLLEEDMEEEARAILEAYFKNKDGNNVR